MAIIDTVRAHLVAARGYLALYSPCDRNPLYRELYEFYHDRATMLLTILDYAAGVPCPWVLPDEPPYIEPKPRKRRQRGKSTPAAQSSPQEPVNACRPLLVQASPRVRA